MEDYYQKVIKLQELLRKSEEERLNLEMKFNQTVQQMRQEEEVQFKKFRSKYKKFLEDDRKRQQRNDKILETLDRIENRTQHWQSKVEKFNEVRKNYRDYISKNPELSTREDRPSSFLSDNFSKQDFSKQDFSKPLDNSAQLAKYSNLGNINSLYCKFPSKTDADASAKTGKDYANVLRQRTESSFVPTEPSYSSRFGNENTFSLRDKPQDTRASYFESEKDDQINAHKDNLIFEKPHISVLSEVNNVLRRLSTDFIEKRDENEKFDKFETPDTTIKHNLPESVKYKIESEGNVETPQQNEEFLDQNGAQPIECNNKLIDENVNNIDYNVQNIDYNAELQPNQYVQEELYENRNYSIQHEEIPDTFVLEPENVCLEEPNEANVIQEQNEIVVLEQENSQELVTQEYDQIAQQSVECIQDVDHIPQDYNQDVQPIETQDYVPEVVQISQDYTDQGGSVKLDEQQECSSNITAEEYVPDGQVAQEVEQIEQVGEGQEYVQDVVDQGGEPVYQQEYNYGADSQVYQQYDENGQIYQQQEYAQDGQYVDENGQIYQQFDENGQPYQGYDENGQYVGEQYADQQQYQGYDQGAEYINQEYDNTEDIQAENIDSEVVQPEEVQKDVEERKNVMEMLETDTSESVPQESKISNDSDFA